MEKFKLEKWQKVGIALCGAGLLCSLLLFIPFVQNLALDFGEKFLVHRPLTRAVWIERFVKWGMKLCGVCFISGLFILSFNNIENKMVKNIVIPTIGFFIIAIPILLQSPLNPFSNGYSGTDSSVFRYVAMVMQNGGVPYKDAFDHKGPLLFFINFFGSKISFDYGVWIIEAIFMGLTMFISYRLARLFVSSGKSLISIAFVYLLMRKYFEGGNLTEEYSILFITLALYIFMDYFLSEKISVVRLILCGVSFASVLLLRANMIAVWFVFCIMVLIRCIKKNEIQSLLKFIAFFLIGMAIVFIPTFIYFGKNNALTDIFENYLLFNIRYSSNTSFNNRISSIIHFFSTTQFVISFVTVLFLIENDRERKNLFLNIGYLILLVVSLFLTSMSGRTYGHYGMALIPLLIYPCCIFVDFIVSKEIFILYSEKKYTKKVISIIFISYIILSELSFIRTMNTNKSEYLAEVVKYIQSKTDDSDKILVFGNTNLIYIKSKRFAASKYSYQSPIANIDTKISKEFISDIEKSMPKIIVVSNHNSNGNTTSQFELFLQKNNYTPKQVSNYVIYERK